VAAEIIGLASDHAAYELKAALTVYLKNAGFQVRDFGTHSAESCNYPEFIYSCTAALKRGEIKRAIVACGSGIGASICANKTHKTRAALCLEAEQAEMSRRHNDANCLVLAGRIRSIKQNIAMADVWLKTEFDGGRHAERIELLQKLSDCNTNCQLSE
jgi:ribose 5-phosphate isomerase B